MLKEIKDYYSMNQELEGLLQNSRQGLLSVSF